MNKRPRYKLTIPQRAALKLLTFAAPYWKGDKSYLSMRYRIKMRKRINWENPQTFTEKIQWLKVNNRREEYHPLVDKEQVKPIVANILGDRYIIPTLGAWDRFDEIDFDKLPDQFVLKTTHSGGSTGVIVVQDKHKLNKEEAKAKLERSQRTDIAITLREWPYKGNPHRIIAEKYMENDPVYGLNDFKFFCFGGKVKFFKIIFNNASGHHANFYDLNWNLLEMYEEDTPKDPSYLPGYKEALPEMVSCAEKIAQGHPFLRVDFYNVKGKVYFGEITFSPTSGMDFYEPLNADKQMGDLLTLPAIGGC